MQESDISKLFRPPTYLLIAGSILSLSAVIFFGQPILAKQLDNWQLLPRPERVTEFFFSDYHPASVSANTDGVQTVEFTVRNLEHRTTDYHYTLWAVSAGGGVEQQVGNGSFALDHGHSKKTSERIILPKVGARVAVKAKLKYHGIALGDLAPSVQAQSIHYWTEPPAPDEDEGDHGI